MPQWFAARGQCAALPCTACTTVEDLQHEPLLTDTFPQMGSKATTMTKTGSYKTWAENPEEGCHRNIDSCTRFEVISIRPYRVGFVSGFPSGLLFLGMTWHGDMGRCQQLPFAI